MPNGVHNFEYLLNGDFYKNYFPETEIINANIKLNIEVEREENFMIAGFNFSGYFELPCDRCLQPCMVSINGKNTLFFKSESNNTEETNIDIDIIIVDKNVESIDMAEFIYEFSMLLIPQKRVHGKNHYSNSECNQKMLNLIEKYSQSESIEHRWDALLSVKSN